MGREAFFPVKNPSDLAGERSAKIRNSNGFMLFWLFADFPLTGLKRPLTGNL
jgi:hypothetical protein